MQPLVVEETILEDVLHPDTVQRGDYCTNALHECIKIKHDHFYKDPVFKNFVARLSAYLTNE